jgi:hypothetical protein
MVLRYAEGVGIIAERYIHINTVFFLQREKEEMEFHLNHQLTYTNRK